MVLEMMGTSMAMGMGIVFLIVMLASYIYMAIALMTIAHKTNTDYAWLAWIPIANLYLITQVAGVPWWTFLILLVGSFIPMLGGLIALALWIWWWWKISEVRGKPGWLGILMVIPIIQWVVIGVIAWSD